MNKSNKLLSDIVAFRTYAKYLPHLNRRESLEETINRKMVMDLDKFGSLSKSLSKDIIKAYGMVHDLKIMPSMRGLQFAGEAVLKNNVRQYNCSALPIDDVRSFGETLYLLLSGVGVGFSVQKTHINKLPRVKNPKEEGIFLVHDSIEGWCQAVDLLMDAYFYGRIRPVFDFKSIRPKGSYLVTTGAKAPGPEPLKFMLEKVEEILIKNIGKKLSAINVHDIICLISDSVLAGGIRRAALISLFDRDDEEMLKAKSGEWWIKHPYRARANNSAVLPREEVTKKEFMHIFNICRESGSGEPGFSWTSNTDMLFNPCFTGDMHLKTKNGFIKFKNLLDQDLELYNYKNEIVKGKVWSNGIKETVNVKFSSGEVLKLTPDHIVMLNDGTECMAKNLKGKRLMPSYNLKDQNDDFVKLGFIQGDGCLGRIKSDTHKSMEIHIGENDFDIAQLFNVNFELDKTAYYIKGFNDVCKDLKFNSKPLPERTLPETYHNWNINQKASFLRGLYSANGCVIKKGRVSFKTTCLELIEELQDTLKNDFNISSYVTTNKPKKVKFNNGEYTCRESYDLNIGQFQNIIKFANSIGFVHKYKNDDLEKIILEKSPLVLSVKEGNIEEVFDFTLYDDTHWGIVSDRDNVCGYVAHNCHEISLQSNQFCNLVTINQTNIKNEKDFMNRIYSATLLATLQASYTDFSYLRDIWKETTEKESLIGVSFTGIADNNNTVNAKMLQNAAKLVLETNEKYAKKLGINLAARSTTLKPEGSSSCVLASSSGIHARHSDYYLRRIRMNKDDALAVYLSNVIPDLVEDDKFSSNGVVITIPQESPQNAVTREKESALGLFNRAMLYNRNWVKPGHRSGDNRNNVSCTISVKEDEWDELGEQMWNQRDLYSGISLLPYDGGKYEQAPFEECNKKTFTEYMELVDNVDLKNVKEEQDNTTRAEQIACGGGKCEIV